MHDEKKHGKWIPGYEGMYSITTDGRVYSHKDNKKLNIDPTEKTVMMLDDGIKFIHLHRPPRVTDKRKIGRLVLTVHGGQPRPSPLHLVGYRDGDFENTSLENLFWYQPTDLHREDLHGKFVEGFPDYSITKEGVLWSFLGRFPVKFTGETTKAGYTRYTLRGRDGKVKRRMAHQLVLEAYVGPKPEDKPFVCHNDGNPTNNALSNLRYDTPKGNSADKQIHGTQVFGTEHPQAKLDPPKVREIRKLLKTTNRTMVDIGREFGVSKRVVFNIKHRQSWRHVV